MRKIWLILMVLVAGQGRAFAVNNGVQIQDIQGSHMGQYLFQLTVTFHLTSYVASIRIPTPAVNYFTDSNEFRLLENAPGTGVAVLNMNGTPGQWQIAQPYNNGLASAGMWIWVWNPDQTFPYAPYDFQLNIAVQDINAAYAFSIGQDIQVFSSGDNFTNATLNIDSDSPSIQSGVASAMAMTGTSFHGGNLGRIERYHAWMLKNLNFGQTDLARASDVLSAGLADCDGAVNLLCALMRAGSAGGSKVACKPMMTGQTGASTSLFLGSAGLHSVGNYWNGGGKWVNYEGQWAENFASAGQVFISAVEDLEYAYIQYSGTGLSQTTATFSGTRIITNHDSFSSSGMDPARTIPPTNPQKMLYTRQSLVALRAPYSVTPHDSTSLASSYTGVPEEGPMSGFKIEPLQNPARGSIKLAMTLPSSGTAEVDLYDVGGRRVAVVQPKKYYAAGTSSIQHFGAGMNSGVYYARMTWNGRSTTTKVIFER